jgi:hypothetical protein
LHRAVVSFGVGLKRGLSSGPGSHAIIAGPQTVRIVRSAPLTWQGLRYTSQGKARPFRSGLRNLG